MAREHEFSESNMIGADVAQSPLAPLGSSGRGAMRCAKCGAENPDRAKFCVECASPFARRCSSCNAENPQTAKFCLECAKPLVGAGGRSQRVPDAGSPIQVNTGTAEALEGERKVVTFLFADIK